MAALLLAVPPVIAGDLDDFEKKTAEEKKEKSENKDSIGRDIFIGVLGTVFATVFYHAGRATLAEARERDKGIAVLPLARLDLNLQAVHGDVSAVDAAFETGYGPAGLHLRHTQYNEKKPDDTLKLTQIHGVYRLSNAENFEFGMGLGALVVDGNDTASGLSLTYPFRYLPFERLALKFAPTWSWIHGQRVSDYDAAVSYVRKFYAVSAGYRRTKADTQVLEGPYLGISFFY